MKISFAENAKSDIVVFLIEEGSGLPKEAKALDEESGGLLSEALSSDRFEGIGPPRGLIRRWRQRCKNCPHV